MTPYNVEFFDRNLNNIHHTNIPCTEISWDYLSPSESTIEIDHIDEDVLKKFVFVRIQIAINLDFFGVVKKISSGTYLDTVTIKQAECLFERDILLDLDAEKSGYSLENTLGDIIKSEWMNEDDEFDYYPFTFSYPTETYNWKYNLDQIYGNENKMIVNFYNDIVAYALSNYKIVIRMYPNFNTKKIEIVIEKVDEIFYIEADLKSVEIEEFTIKDQSNSINKLTVWNLDDYAQKMVFYLHNDGKYDDINQDRVTPVLASNVVVSVSEDASFSEMANNEAYNQFVGQGWQNNIELKFLPNDSLVKPMTIQIGQNANIIRYGVAYNSGLTGKVFNEDGSIKLIFGVIRHDLTKILNKQKGAR